MFRMIQFGCLVATFVVVVVVYRKLFCCDSLIVTLNEYTEGDGVINVYEMVFCSFRGLLATFVTVIGCRKPKAGNAVNTAICCPSTTHKIPNSP